MSFTIASSEELAAVDLYTDLVTLPKRVDGTHWEDPQDLVQGSKGQGNPAQRAGTTSLIGTTGKKRAQGNTGERMEKRRRLRESLTKGTQRLGGISQDLGASDKHRYCEDT
jgi:hypothetical protein